MIDDQNGTENRMSIRAEQQSAPGRVERFVDAVAVALAGLGTVFLVFITGLTVVSIVGRASLTLFGFLGPVPGDFEMVEIASGVAIFFFLPLCQMRRGHVTVDILSPVIGPRGVALTDAVGNLLMTVASAVILWRLCLGLKDKLGSGEESFILGIPTWWGYAAALPGAAWFVAACAATVLRAMSERRAVDARVGGV